MKKAGALCVVVVLAGCASAPGPAPEEPQAAPQAKEAPPSRPGGYYKDDGPGENPPANLASIPDAVPKREPPHRFANRPYTVFGTSYVPLAAAEPYKERGLASWYGRRFHGQKTSSGEIYDMYGMTAAHKTLPIPSYARVTNLANGRSVVVRINDRGPFHSERIIDLSYAAAYKLGFSSAGSARVEVEAIAPAETPEERKPEQQEAEAKGVYLQMGAFSARQNAEDLRARLAGQLSWIGEGLRVLSVGNLWRLYAGPYASGDAARSVAQRIEAEISLKPLLVTR